MNNIYFDNCSTTRLDKAVLDKMLPYLTEEYGNASSIHSLGRAAKNAVERSRVLVADILKCSASEVIFTSSATEANNLGISAILKKTGKKHIITSVIEHQSVLAKIKQLEEEGYLVTYVPVDSGGTIDLELLEQSINENTALISIMHANNEIGTIQPIQKVAKLAKKHDVLFHVDAVQTVGRLSTNLVGLGVDLFSFSAHKLYGPKGAAVLYVKKDVQIESLLYGGHQERNRRAGTENVAAIVGLASALENAVANAEEQNIKEKELKDYFEHRLVNEISEVSINGNIENRLPGISNVLIKSVKGDLLVFSMDMLGIYISTGAACASGSIKPSHVLKALGLSDEAALSSIRFSFGKYNNKSEIDIAIESLKEVIKNMRKVVKY